ncbi:MAG TPA: UdgX family uracil-DNA binding protein, partial [Rhodanobacteraceae bacterium]|nr:UdgX family uracil-DNA binding protein [Rhodanobacteraceae bacterium]
AAAECRGCELFRRATQTVFGEGAPHARIMLVGETPGDREDFVGRPFVGPAGQLLDRALDAAEIDRAAVYVTNVVKHFKWEPRGKRRLHKRPRPSEIAACMPWLRMEIDLVRAEIIVCLGATAGQALFGSRFSVTRERGRFLASSYAPFVLATLHPSALLRIGEADERHEAFEHFVADLRLVHDAKPKAPP